MLNNNEPVFIAGTGIISAIGNHVAECLDALENGRAGMGQMRYLHSAHGNRLPVAEVKLDNEELAQLAQPHVTGLVTLVLRQSGEIPAACKSLWRFRGRLEQPICACFVAPELIDHVPLLLESGAHIVISQLDTWQRALTRILNRASLSKQGFHPLTGGLVDRLPWPAQV